MRLKRQLCWFAAVAMLPAAGCLAGIERGLDMLLAPSAGLNALFLPYSAVWPIAQFLLRTG